MPGLAPVYLNQTPNETINWQSEAIAEMNYSPADIQVNLAKQTLTIIWGDNHVSRYPLFALRQQCPCVECRGGHQNMGGGINPADLLVPPIGTIGVTNLDMVGNYAVKISWDDGHDMGIYTWKMLRQACPCEVCYKR